MRISEERNKSIFLQILIIKLFPMNWMIPMNYSSHDWSKMADWKSLFWNLTNYHSNSSIQNILYLSFIVALIPEKEIKDFIQRHPFQKKICLETPRMQIYPHHQYCVFPEIGYICLPPAPIIYRENNATRLFVSINIFPNSFKNTDHSLLLCRLAPHQ